MKYNILAKIGLVISLGLGITLSADNIIKKESTFLDPSFKNFKGKILYDYVDSENNKKVPVSHSAKVSLEYYLTKKVFIWGFYKQFNFNNNDFKYNRYYYGLGYIDKKMFGEKKPLKITTAYGYDEKRKKNIIGGRFYVRPFTHFDTFVKYEFWNKVTKTVKGQTINVDDGYWIDVASRIIINKNWKVGVTYNNFDNEGFVGIYNFNEIPISLQYRFNNKDKFEGKKHWLTVIYKF